MRGWSRLAAVCRTAWERVRNGARFCEPRLSPLSLVRRDARIRRPTMTPATPEVRPASAALSVVVRADEGGPELTRETVSDSDLLDAQGELWLDGFLRKGRPTVALDDLACRTVPLPG